MRALLLIALLQSQLEPPAPETPPATAAEAVDAGPSAIPLPQILRSAEEVHRTVRSTLERLDHAVVSLSVAQRTRELGIRLALGADRLRLVRMAVAGGLRTALFGVVLGWARPSPARGPCHPWSTGSAPATL